MLKLRTSYYNKVQRKFTNKEKVFAMHVSDKQIYIELP